MKDKEKQIEEMGRIICKFSHDYYGKVIANCSDCGLRKCVSKSWAKALYEAGYRKLPENAFILTDDNAEELANLIVTSPQMQSVMSDLIKAWQKETAEEIFNQLIWYAIKIIGQTSVSNYYQISFERIKELAKQYGVEIKE